MATGTLDCVQRGIRSPHDVVSIKWEENGASGSTECEAWRAQHEIDQLEAAGYKVIDVEKV